MTGHLADQPHAASEDDIIQALSALRLHEERWDEYRRAMNTHTSHFEEAAVGLGTSNYFVQKALAARREVDRYVGQLALQQSELLAESSREIASITAEEGTD